MIVALKISFCPTKMNRNGTKIMLVGLKVILVRRLLRLVPLLFLIPLTIHNTLALLVLNQCFNLRDIRERYQALRKHAYSNILRILPPKNENFQMKNSDLFLISAQNIDCRYSLEPPR